MATDSTPIRVIDRESGDIIEEVIAGERALRWVYGRSLGRLSLEALVKRRIASYYYGVKMDRPSSRRLIGAFAEELGIDLSEAEKTVTEFDSFKRFLCAAAARRSSPGRE